VAGVSVDDGLVVHGQDTVSDGGTEVLFQAHPFHSSGMHGGFEDAVAALSLSFRPVHRRISVSHKSVSFGASLVGKRDSDTRADRDLSSR
jgi:hypothetical protein